MLWDELAIFDPNFQHVKKASFDKKGIDFLSGLHAMVYLKVM